MITDPRSGVTSVVLVDRPANVLRVDVVLLARVPISDAGDVPFERTMVFVTAFEAAAEAMARFRVGDLVRVAGPLTLLRREVEGEMQHALGCLAHSVESERGIEV